MPKHLRASTGAKRPGLGTYKTMPLPDIRSLLQQAAAQGAPGPAAAALGQQAAAPVDPQVAGLLAAQAAKANLSAPGSAAPPNFPVQPGTAPFPLSPAQVAARRYSALNSPAPVGR